MSQSNMNARIEWLDVAKGFGAFFVVLGHTLSTGSSMRGLIFSFHMPLFFILSGYTFKQKDWRENLRSSFKRLVVPYILLFLVWNVPHYLMSAQEVTLNNVIHLVLCAFFASGTTVPGVNVDAVGMSWFLMALFISRILFNAAMGLSSKTKHPDISLFFFCAVSFVVGKWLGGDLKIYLPLSLDVSLVSLIFIWGGYFVKLHQFNYSSHAFLSGPISLLILLLASSYSDFEMAARLYSPAFVSVVAAFAGTYFICWISDMIKKLKDYPILNYLYRGIKYCGINSMSIYCFHALDWWIPWTALPVIMSLPLSHLFSSFSTFLYSVMYCKLIEKIQTSK